MRVKSFLERRAPSAERYDRTTRTHSSALCTLQLYSFILFRFVLVHRHPYLNAHLEHSEKTESFFGLSPSDRNAQCTSSFSRINHSQSSLAPLQHADHPCSRHNIRDWHCQRNIR